jgi:hypothetical protein
MFRDAVAERLRRQLRAVIGDYPTVPDAADAVAAGDDVFEAITNVLRNKTRDQSMFPTVFDELVHCGFWRNCCAFDASVLQSELSLPPPPVSWRV